MRLRTLPLSLSGIILGSCLACINHTPSILALVFLVLTTIGLQVLSNMSNELGDTLNGVDSDERQGIHYSLQDGDLSIIEIKRLIAGAAVFCCISGLIMIYGAFGTLFSWISVSFMVLGALAIAAAMKYTLGKNPYGYRGLGDISVFIFFGLVTVCGAYFICAGEFDTWTIIIPGAVIGCFSVGVLNVNNIRDMKTDAESRVTVAIKLGARRAKIYQTVLICTGWVLMVVYAAITPVTAWKFLFILSVPMFVKHLVGVWKKTDRELDPMLPLLVMGTFLFSILAGAGFLI